ncbi:MAG TPA: phosphoribosylformylglycinamidine synthase, partial [Nitrosomonas sp.]|nr:phosphoribosylformylglycinamidine synthase [Nitrosomonas sp.]
MLQFRGRQALSSFRLGKLSHQIRSIVSEFIKIESEYWYFCSLQQNLTQNELIRLQQLLDGHLIETLPQVPHGFFLVLPRLGTVSPWSSKATDIAHHCQLQSIGRIERGVAFNIEFQSHITDESRKRVEALLHDRMTESIFSSLQEASKLFRHIDPGSLQTIDIQT